MLFQDNLRHDLSANGITALRDFCDSLVDIISDMERHIAQLNRTPSDIVQIQALFKELNQLKHNAITCQLSSIVSYLQPLEDLASEIRARKVEYIQLIGEMILLCIDRLQLVLEDVQQDGDSEALHLDEICGAMAELPGSAQADLVQKTINMIEMISGHKVANNYIQEIIIDLDDYLLETFAAPTSSSTSTPAPSPIAIIPHDDWPLFRQLAQLLEHRSHHWDGRTERNLWLARQTNLHAGEAIDPLQLDVAVVLHDIGMAFLPDKLWNKQGKLTELEIRVLREHPDLGASLLERMPGWESAVEMIHQHHERIDGSGYPLGLIDPAICTGAKLLAIIDAFESMTHERGDRYLRRSMLRAVSEINASENLFDRFWVGHFNAVVKQLIQQQQH
ncbi:HD domain-containing protein [Chitinibacter fontanus]|uniref:HD domain-containing protein n=1 Tax=Chitinibacter fontanus TaxID=1737446 RepID=A0A7D5VBQ8_9NEIS|nr:HD domain-containing phosphohydrolase [Chitinibacter fontanus]QLI82975.1 HD domain-containing protein [Chitinibacter fontanus]